MSFYIEFKNNNVSKLTHKYFSRFGRGKFSKEKSHIRVTKKNVSFNCGYEYLHQFMNFVAKNINENATVKGKFISLSEAKDIFEEFSSLEVTKSDLKFKKVEFNGELNKDQLASFIEKTTTIGVLLMNVKTSNLELKTKEKIPKADKLKEKFCSLKCEGELIKLLKDEFFPEAPDSIKKGYVQHTYDINSIEIPEGLEGDLERARLESTRVGILTRVSVFDDVEKDEQIKFKA